MRIDLARVPARLERNDTILFSESASRFVVTVHEDMADRFENAMDGTVMARVGEIVGQPRFVVDGLDGTTVIDADIYELKEAWQKPLRW